MLQYDNHSSIVPVRRAVAAPGHRAARAGRPAALVGRSEAWKELPRLRFEADPLIELGVTNCIQ